MFEQEISQKLDSLPDALKLEALDFISFLVSKTTSVHHQQKRSAIQSKHLNFEWENALSDLKPKISSVELQKKASEWR